jgi:hypothetical protein
MRSVSLPAACLFFTLSISSIESWLTPKSPLRSILSPKISSPRQSCSKFMSSSDDKNANESVAESPRVSSRPPIIPFDFARDDIMPKKKAVETLPKTTDGDNIDSSYSDTDVSGESSSALVKGSSRWTDNNDEKVVVRSANSDRRNKWVEDPSRPTGYGNVDEDDDDWVPSSDSEGVEKFLKDYFFNSPYDSPKRKDAKFVIRNVTFISGALGTIFTILFYAFPGRFISYRGTADFSQRYASDFVNKDPSELLNDQVNDALTKSVEIGGESFYDDGVGLPEPDNSRVPYPKKASDARAPGRTENL